MDAKAERALLRTLADIEDGHLSLWLRGRWFDPSTGERIAQPTVEVIPDRQPYYGVPDYGGEWWTNLLERGWLEMPAPGTTPMRYLVSEAGRDALRAAGLRRRMTD